MRDQLTLRADMRRGLHVSLASIALTLAVGAVEVGLGIASHVLTLLVFGAAGALDAAGSATLAAHFRRALRDDELADRSERRAGLVVSASLIGLGAITLVESVRRLASHGVAHASWLGSVIAVGSLAVLPILARAKHRIGRRLASSALVADGWLSMSGAILAAIAVGGATIGHVRDLWWVDPLAAAAIAVTAGAYGIVVLARGRRRIVCRPVEKGVDVLVHFANLWEAIADEVGDRTALIHGDRHVTWREYDGMAARLAEAFTAYGLQPDAKVALYLYNGIEYEVAQYAAFKIRAVPVNVNYRYTDNELLYLLDNSDAEVVVFHSSLGDRVARIRDKAAKLRAVIEVDDGGAHLEGAERFEDVVATHEPAARIEGQPDDVYMLYTGGTTGMPKGVMYTQGVFPLAISAFGASVYGRTPPTTADELLALGDQLERPPVWLAACPQMHGTGMWLGTMVPLLLKGSVVTLTQRSFDAAELWRAVERESVDVVVIVGDAFAKPMLRALDEGQFSVPSLRAIVSSGVMWSTEVKEGLLRHLDVMLYDALGSTEGSMGATISTRQGVGVTAKFTSSPSVKVVTEDGRVVEPGSDEIGMVAAVSASLGYFKDPQKSARTFKVIDGVPHSLPGDWAKVASDGSLILLGRGSNCINTGGEKVFPEEVEEAVKAHPAVWDCLVVGVADERFGERVVAVASLHSGRSATAEDILQVAGEHVARYKLPKQILLVERVQRAPNGKADYPWAREVAGAAAPAPAAPPG